MKKIKTFNYLKHYREQSGFSLQDIAGVLAMHPATLSRIESGIITPGIEVIFAYHFILDLSIEKLFKEHVIKVVKSCLSNAEDLQEKLLDQRSTTSIHKRLSLIEIIISRLEELESQYE
ncbi:helix-turn-helix domain-containing protein [Pseudotenacibaculum haliotis]|uniref:Helix-turn-helix domain-containing protein n=1 Tax=Pseudotenacibaculum haliotis TaxID=1862138 RepID=A0ABW5LMZ0_9FLAO